MLRPYIYIEPLAPSGVLLQFANPDVAVANRMIVVLKRKRQLVRACFVRRTYVMAGWAGGLNVVLREDAVVKDGDARRPSQFPRCVEARAVPDNVVGLPLAGCARSIHQRRILAVHG